jgi:peptidoglycan hydrolase-like protein with peptidoglycan-binding domain
VYRVGPRRSLELGARGWLTTEGPPPALLAPQTPALSAALDAFGRGPIARAPLAFDAALPALDPSLASALSADLTRRRLAATSADELRARAGGAPGPVEPPAGPTVGARGPAVRRAERQLAKAGFDPGKVDGVFDAQTARALRRFQAAVARDPNAPTSGVLDAATRETLQHVSERIARSDGHTLGIGQRGARVRDVERRLARLGYDVGEVDGTYDRATGKALQQLRTDQGWRRGDMIMGRRAERALRRARCWRWRTTPSGSASRARPSSGGSTRGAAAAARANPDGTTGLGEGAGPSRVVKSVQRHLRAAGYDPKHVDGRFDERTRGALEQFQRRSGLPVTGRVDPRTWRELSGATMEARSAWSPTQREGERSAAVRRTERMLNTLGYRTGKVDGLYTEATQRAVDRFRAKHHLGERGQGVSRAVHNAMAQEIRERSRPHTTALGRRLASNARSVAMSMGGYDSQGLCATGVSRAIQHQSLGQREPDRRQPAAQPLRAGEHPALRGAEDPGPGAHLGEDVDAAREHLRPHGDHRRRRSHLDE